MDIRLDPLTLQATIASLESRLLEFYEIEQQRQSVSQDIVAELKEQLEDKERELQDKERELQDKVRELEDKERELQKAGQFIETLNKDLQKKIASA